MIVKGLIVLPLCHLPEIFYCVLVDQENEMSYDDKDVKLDTPLTAEK